MKTTPLALLILVLDWGCRTAPGPGEPVVLALVAGIEQKLMPIRFPGGRTVYFGETEVTNAMWQSYLTATGQKRLDDVELLNPWHMTPAEKEEERRQLIADGWSDPGVIEDDESVPVDKDAAAVPPEQLVEGENSGMAGSSSVRDESLLWRQGEIPEGKEDYPVTFVTVRKAYEFCRWLSKRVPEGWAIRLPTREEWVWAAYGGTRRFPWGNRKREIAPGLLYPVKTHPELNTPEGLFNMYGNASEFIQTDADGYGGRASPDEVPYITQWMGTDAYEPWDIPKRDYFGYVHISRVRRDCWGFRFVMVPIGGVNQ